jgi:two-component system response regulator PilR (NtrC family)
MMPLLQRAYKAACVSDITVLLEGETGTGKQVLARAIHGLDGKRSSSSFVTVHCGTISPELAESELFGHLRGAFSGAVGDRTGLFSAAHRGTLLLDDVNDLPLRLQPKLLDVLQRGKVRSVGSDKEVRVDVRVIAAANRSLEPLVKEGAFRADLYHRLNVIRLRLPALRERPEDVSALMLEFARRYNGLHARIDSIDPELLALLAARRFEGNVRELENAVQRMLFLKVAGNSLTCADWLAQSSLDELEDHQDPVREAGRILWRAIGQDGITFADLIARIESELLTRALQSGGRTRREIAKLLRTSERTLYHKMRAHGLSQAS